MPQFLANFYSLNRFSGKFLFSERLVSAISSPDSSFHFLANVILFAVQPIGENSTVWPERHFEPSVPLGRIGNVLQYGLDRFSSKRAHF